MDQIPQVAGAILILLAFAASQRGTMSQHSRIYLWLNLVGSAILTVVAFTHQDWGFFLLEVVWALVSAWGLIALARGQTPSAAH